MREEYFSWGSIFFLLGTGLVFFYFQPNYLRIEFPLLLGLIGSPFIWRKVSDDRSNRFAPLALGLGLLLFVLPSNSIYYFFWVALLLLGIEQTIGRLNNLPLFLLLILSYLVQQVLTNWSFPIRLELSEWAGIVLNGIGYEATIRGNIIDLAGTPFSVDPACMGLNMMVTSLLLTAMILGYWEQKRSITFRVMEIGSILLLVIGLNIITNFTRILALVLFRIFPDTLLHDAVGIIALAVYTLLPTYWGIGKYVDFLKRRDAEAQRKREASSTILQYLPKQAVYVFGFFLLCVHGQQLKYPAIEIGPSFPIKTFAHFQKSQTPNGITKLENDSTLIYIKPPVKFFQGSHDPRVCWRGEGYTFSNIQVEYSQNTPIYTAVLKQEGDLLHTAWWYDNLEETTIEQWQWRWDGFQGQAGYFLVNVACPEKEQLLEQITQLLRVRTTNQMNFKSSD